jgi:ElaB/YqjD/DUF883 family membrane-anchored ribosome-binding protein
MADRSGEVAEWSTSTMHNEHEDGAVGRAGTMVVELVEATRSAAEALLEDQKQRVASQVKGLAEAVRSAAQSLDRSESWGLGNYAGQAAGQIEQLSELIGQRSWSEILAETRSFARRRPWMFLGAAAAAGFVAGRMLWLPGDRQRHLAAPGSQPSPRGNETAEITAAISSGESSFTGKHADASTGVETH